MPPVALPLTFTNSFWSQDYRRGLETLFRKLEQGVAEDAEIVSFIEARMLAEYDLAAALSIPAAAGPRGTRLTSRRQRATRWVVGGTGFSADDGASLLMAFWGLKQETKVQADGHRALANDLKALALQPFSAWAKAHEQRVRDAKLNLLDVWLSDYEISIQEVEKLKNAYHGKTRKADEAEDDAKFAPNSDYSDHYTSTSPRMNGRNAVVNRTASVSERIAERLRELRGNKDGNSAAPSITTTAVDAEPSETDKEKQDGETTPTLAKMDKGKGKAVEETGSPLPMSPVAKDAPPLPAKGSMAPPPPILVAGIAMQPAKVSLMLERAAAELPLRSVRFPILGEYTDCFTGEELVRWLRDNVEAFGGNLDLADEAARGLGEDHGLLRRIGELGNEFEPSTEAFYQFRPKAFHLAEKDESLAVPVAAAENLLKRSGTLANFVMKQMRPTGGQPPHLKARQDAHEADGAYRMAIRQLDRQRLGLEDRIEETLKILQRWEVERLRAVKDVLLKYHATLANLPSSIQPSIDRTSTLIASYQPENDLTALIERYRTGPFRPTAHVYESVSHDGTDVVFGIDLLRWAGESGWAAVRVPEDEKKKDMIPPILASLLKALEIGYGKLSSDDERRKAWIYEIPLPILHHLREALNAQPLDQPIPVTFFEKVDVPVLAGMVKLWLLELNPPVATWEGWEDFRKIYPQRVKTEESASDRIENIKSALYRLPKVHLYVLDAVIKHVKSMVYSTKSEEDLDTYLTKLAYSLGRAILRPIKETEVSVQDRHPTYLFVDLIKHYDEILPPTITKKKRESDKPLPIRKRTTLVDQRINRRSVVSDPKQLLQAREAQIRAPSPSRVPATVPPVPAVPSAAAATTTATNPDDGLPPRPKFTTPPPETDDLKTQVSKAPLVVSPPTPDRVASPAGSPDRASSPKRDPPRSPPLEDKPLISAATSLARSGSGETSRVRRPGGARGPRAAPGNATSPTSHRASGSFSELRPKSPPKTTPAADPKEYIPKKKDGKASAGLFRKNMASGSEDEGK